MAEWLRDDEVVGESFGEGMGVEAFFFGLLGILVLFLLVFSFTL